MQQLGYLLVAVQLAALLGPSVQLAKEVCSAGDAQEYEALFQENFVQGLNFTEKHLNGTLSLFLNDSTPEQFMVVQLLRSILFGAKNITESALTSVKCLNEDDVTNLGLWLKRNFSFKRTDIHNVIKNYANSNYGIAPNLDGLMVKLAKDYELLQDVNVRNDENVTKWLHQNGYNELKEVITESELNITGKASKEKGRVISKESQSLLNFLLEKEYFKSISYLLNKKLVNIDHITLLYLKQNGTSLSSIIEFLPNVIRWNETIKLTDAMIDAIISQKNVNSLVELLSVGYPVNQFQDDGLTLLYKSIMSQANESTAALLKSGADVDAASHCNRTLLHSAVVRKEVRVLAELIHLGANMYATDCQGMTPMHLAIVNDDQNVIHSLFESNFNLSTKFDEGKTLLHFAAVNGTEDTVETLVSSGSAVDAENNDGVTPLFESLLKNRFDNAQLLLHAGANISRASHDGSTYLHKAVEKDSKAIVSFLIKNGVPLDVKNRNGETALSLAVKLKNSDMVNLLKLGELGAEIDTIKNLLLELIKNSADNGTTVISNAVKKDDVKSMAILKSLGVDINQQIGNSSESLLHQAARWGSLQAIDWLILNGVPKDVKDSDGKTSLHVSSENGQLTALRRLIAKGCAVNDQTKNKEYTPLHYASIKGHTETIKELINAGAHINIANVDGWTGLHEAAFYGHVLVAKELIKGGADLHAKTKDKKYVPLHLASMEGHSDIVKELITAGTDINIANVDGRTGLHECSFYGHLSVIKVLLENGADVTLKTHDKNYTALQLATMGGHLEAIKELKSHRPKVLS